jgi:hypothetical protein
MSFDKAPRKKSLIKHPPSPSMSARQEVRLLSKQLRKLEDKEPTPETINLMLRLSQRIGVLRKQISPPVKRPVGRPKQLKPVEPEVVVNESLAAILEAEKERRETPEPSIVFEHAKRAEVKAEMKKEREVIENPPITAPQSDVQEPDGVVVSSSDLAEITREAEASAKKQSSTDFLMDTLRMMARPLEMRSGAVLTESSGPAETACRLRDFGAEPPPPSPEHQGMELVTDGMSTVWRKRGQE